MQRKDPDGHIFFKKCINILLINQLETSVDIFRKSVASSVAVGGRRLNITRKCSVATEQSAIIKETQSAKRQISATKLNQTHTPRPQIE